MVDTIGSALTRGAARLGHLPGTAPRHEAERLLGLATQLSRSQILAWPERLLWRSAQRRFDRLLERRAAGEPFAYLSGTQGFWSLQLRVTPATLVPRPETEMLVELALASLPEDARLRVADLGTGSGAIAVALASERPLWQIVATERCPAAVRVARENLSALGIESVALLLGDWLTPFSSNCFDAILSNPPYVRDLDPHLTSGALDHEPRLALAAGADGLAAIRLIVSTAGSALRPGGLLAVEHGFDQGSSVRALFVAAGLHEVSTRRDLAGLERVTLGYSAVP